MGSRHVLDVCVCELGPERRKLERWRSVRLRHFWCVFSGCYDGTIGDDMTDQERKAMTLAQKALSNKNAPTKTIYEALNAIQKCLTNDALEKKAENARDLGLEY